MNAIIFAAVWGVIMMYTGVVSHRKSVPKYVAIAGVAGLIKTALALRHAIWRKGRPG